MDANLASMTNLNSTTHRFMSDFNGDGKADLLLTLANGSYWLYTSTGTTFQSLYEPPGSIPGTAADLAANSTMRALTGDFNGDGKSDLVFLRTDGSLTAMVATGSL